MIELPVSVKVYDVVVGKSRLWLTNWFYMSKYRTNPSTDANLADLEQYSPAYWELLRKYARDMAEHRQNVAKLSPLELTEYSVGKSGRLRFDFARFDKAVEIFIDEGVIGRIEGSHLGEGLKINGRISSRRTFIKLRMEILSRSAATRASQRLMNFTRNFCLH